jgi:hypothetical protein
MKSTDAAEELATYLYTLIMHAESFSEMMVHSYHTTQQHFLQDSSLYSHCHKNLKSHMRMLGIF